MDDVTFGPILRDDLGPLAILHRAAFPEFFLSKLGEPFLREFYKGFLLDPTSVAVIARDTKGVPIGAAVGSTEPAGYYHRLLRRQFVGLASASLLAIARRPRALLRLVRGAFYRGEVGDEPSAPHGALLSSICTGPTAQGQGVGTLLLQLWERQAAELGAKSAHLSTDAVDNEKANTFYDACGWSLEHEYRTREGRRMNLYRKALAP